MRITSRLKRKLGEERALASKEILDDIIDLIQVDYESAIEKILNEPREVNNWDQQVTMLIGEARSYRKMKSLLTIIGD